MGVSNKCKMSFDTWVLYLKKGYLGVQTGNTGLLYVIENDIIYRWDSVNNPKRTNLIPANVNTLSDGRRVLSIIPPDNLEPRDTFSKKLQAEFAPAKNFKIIKEKI